MLETLAGKTRSNIAASVLMNGEMLEEAYNESAFESANSAIIENEKYLDSLSGHLAQLKTAWQELQTTMVDSSFLKTLTDVGTGALKGTTGFLDQFSPTSLLMTALGGVLGLNGIGFTFDKEGKLNNKLFRGDDTRKFLKNIENEYKKFQADALDDWDMTGNGKAGLVIPATVEPEIDYDKMAEGLNIPDDVKMLAKESKSFDDLTNRINVNSKAWSQLKQVAVGTLLTMGASFAISLGVDFVQKFIDAPKAIAEAAAATGNTIKNELKSIDEYKTRVSELYETLNDPASTIEEQTSARQELLNIQNELLTNYGSEASMLTSVSTGAEAAANAFDRLAESQYRLNMAKFANDEGSGFIKKFANDLNNALNGYEDNVDRMFGEMGRQQIDNAVSRDVLARNKELRDELIKIYQANNLDISETGIWGDGKDNISIVGSARDMQDALSDARKAVEAFRFSMTDEDYSSAVKSLESYSNQIELVIGKYGDLTDQTTKFNTIANNSEYQKYADNLEKYYNAYKEAFASGDKESIDDAATNFTREYGNAIAKAGSDGETGKFVSEYFENLYSTMDSVMGEQNFRKDFDNNLGGMQDTLKDFFDYFKGYTTEDFLNFKIQDPNGQAEQMWIGLRNLADSYGLEVEQLIPIFEEFGMVQSDSYRQLTDLYKDHIDEISNYTPEELQIAYRIAAEGMSFEDLDAQIQKERGLIEIGFDIHDRSGLQEYNDLSSNQKSHHADYDQYKQMMEDAQKLREEGRIGEEQFKKAAELFSEFGMQDAKNWDENYKHLKKYFTEGSEGAQRLVKDMKELKDSEDNAFATDDGKGGFELNLEHMDELAHVLHVPMELLQVLLENLQSFGATEDYFGDMETGVNRLTQLYKEQAAAKAKLEEDKRNGAGKTVLEEDQKAIDDYETSINRVKTGLDQMTEQAAAYENESSEAYKTNRNTLQDLLNEYNSLNKEDKTYIEQKQALKDAIDSYSDEVNIPVNFETENGKAEIDDSIKLAKERITEAAETYKSLTTGKNALPLDDSQVVKAKEDLIAAIEEKQKLEQPAIMDVDVSKYDLEVNDQEAITALQDFMNAWNELQSLNKQEELGIKVDQSQMDAAEQKADSFASKLQEMSQNLVLVKMGIDTSSGDKTQIAPQVKDVDVKEVNDTLGSLKNPTVQIKSNTSNFDKGADHVKSESKAIDALHPVVSVGITGNALSAISSIKNALAGLKDKTVNVTVHKSSSGETHGGSSGEFHNGTFNIGRGYASGNVGALKDELAVVGEEGAEGVVRNGQFFTVGEAGAEMFRVRKGDLIFSAQQTMQLLKNGKITSGKRRATAYAGGTGLSFNTTTTTTEETKKTTTTSTGTGGSKSSGGGSKNKGKGSGKSKSSSKKKSSSSSNKNAGEIFDWIALKVETLEREIKKLDTTASSVFNGWNSRSTDIDAQTKKVKELINVQEQAVQKYGEIRNGSLVRSETDSDVLATFKPFKTNYKKTKKRSSKKAKKLNKKNKTLNSKLQTYQGIIDEGGTIDISTIKNEKLAEKVKNYQDWITKSREAEAAIIDLQEQLKELGKQKFDNISKQFDQLVARIEHRSNMIDKEITASEEHGYIVSKGYYRDLITEENNTVKEISEKQRQLIAQRNQMLNDGTITEGSEEWHEMESEIEGCTEAIADANINILKYNNSIREVDKQIFEMTQDMISYMNKESDFLIDLMADMKLFQDNGQFTMEGLATAASHAVNYDLLMTQADRYRNRMKEVSAELAKDPNNTNLLKEREELLESQQDAIRNANSEKNAIKDLVSQGIDKELDSLKKLIDKYTDLMDEQEDYLAYQKKIRESTKEITSLEKQLAAVQNDNSEAGRATRQKLQNQLNDANEDLQETERDQYNKDMKKNLDDFFEEYSELLNSRLDDIDGIMREIIDTTNQNASSIATTLNSHATEVGYQVSTNLSDIWNTGGKAQNVVSMYSDGVDAIKNYTYGLGDNASKINTTVNDIDSYVKQLASYAYAQKTATEKLAQEQAVANTIAKTESEKKTKTQNAVKEYQQWAGEVTWANSRMKMFKKDSQQYDNAKRTLIEADTKMHRILSDFGVDSIEELKKLAGLAGGSRNPKSGLTWTQENGQEYIIRPSDGAILTPIARGDSVLNAKATSNLWNMANDPSKFIKDNMMGGLNVPSINANNGNYTQNFENVTFNMPNVKNYDQLISQMQRDKNFENLILAMSVDRLAGGSSLSKYKAIR